MKEQQRPGIPLPTIKRIPVYVSVLEKRLKEGKETVSTTDFAAALALKPVQVRKDLAFAGAEGKPRIGYRTEELLETLHRFVGWNNLSEAVLVGAGALGTAILGYKGFDRFGLKIKAAFDIDESKCGATVHDKPVYPIRDLKQYVKKNGIIMGILTVSENGAQPAADALVEAGIQGIWNFSPAQIDVPDSIFVQQEDLAAGLAVLAVRIKERQ